MGKKGEGDEEVEELNLDDGEEGEKEEGQEGEEGAVKEDRGDVVDPEVNPKNLKVVAGDEEEEEEGDEDDKGSKTVPHGRFNEVNEDLKKERLERLRLEEENARLKGEKPAARTDDEPAFDFDAKEEEYANAIIEGDTKKAASIRKTINAQLRKEAKDEAVTEADSRAITREAQSALQSTAASVIKAYPFLDSTSKAKNTEAIADVVEWRDFYMSKGDSPAAALRKAANKVGPMYAKKTDGEDGEDEGDDDEKNRKVTSITKAADASRRQPAAIVGGVGNRATAAKLDVETMSEADFSKLTPEEKKKLRGDAM